jgi:BirA family biotin operon repressor/biotin-[acetyl-CoA-carboxylase] ligase
MSAREKILDMLSQKSGEVVTGSELGSKLGISRSAVWRHIKNLRNEGFKIYSRTNSGYLLDGTPDVLSPSRIVSGLTASLGYDIDVYSTIDSTNTFAKSLAVLNIPHGKTIVSDCHTFGRGQFGHGFYSPSGSGLYMSVVIRPALSVSETMLITTAAATAVSDALFSLCGIDAGIKWVNDIYSKKTSKKLCGILTEASMGMETSQLEYAVIGIGINVNNTSFPAELKKIASSVYLETGRFVERNTLASSILNALDFRLSQIKSAAFLDEYRRRSILIGKDVIVSQGNRSYPARVLEIDDKARLVVRAPNAPITILTSGSVSLIE